MRVLLALYLWVISFCAGAEGIKWFDGVLVLREEQVLTGAVAVQDEYDVILFRVDDRVQVYPACRVAEVRFYDAGANINRHFVSLPGQAPFGQHRLYEVVLNGAVKVVRRLKGPERRDRSDRDDFYYFVQDDQGRLVHMNRFKGMVYPSMLQTCHEPLMQYSRAMKLNPNIATDAIQLIRYYNNLPMIQGQTFSGSQAY